MLKLGFLLKYVAPILKYYNGHTYTTFDPNSLYIL